MSGQFKTEAAVARSGRGEQRVDANLCHSLFVKREGEASFDECLIRQNGKEMFFAIAETLALAHHATTNHLGCERGGNREVRDRSESGLHRQFPNVLSHGLSRGGVGEQEGDDGLQQRFREVGHPDGHGAAVAFANKAGKRRFNHELFASNDGGVQFAIVHLRRESERRNVPRGDGLRQREADFSFAPLVGSQRREEEGGLREVFSESSEGLGIRAGTGAFKVVSEGFSFHFGTGGCCLCCRRDGIVHHTSLRSITIEGRESLDSGFHVCQGFDRGHGSCT